MKTLIIISALLLLAATASAADYSHYENPAYAKAVQEHQARLVIVSAKWCPACQSLEHKLKAADVPFVEIDVDEHPQTAAGFPHATIPQVFLLTSKGGIMHVQFQILDP
jgi:thioredoxin-like negative regulator of GroEL